MNRPGLDPLIFPIDLRALIYSPTIGRVVRFNPRRLVIDCPMCEWVTSAPNSAAGLGLAEIARRAHALSAHSEAITAGGLVMPEVAMVRGEVVTRRPRLAEANL